MIRTATREDLPAIRALFTGANDAPYDLAAVAEEKCFGAGATGEPVVRVVERGGLLAGVSVTSGRYLRVLAVARGERRRGIGTALLEDSGAEVIAAEPGNYFTPGVLTTDSAALAFFRARGFVETQSTTNLHVLLPARESGGSEAIRATQADEGRVLAFVEREFGRFWRFEAARAFERDAPTAFFALHQDEIAGFAVYDANNRGLGTFGPTGVAKPLRGRGIGCQLLLASLAGLHALGHAEAVIPWTSALDFYRQCCGARSAHHFVAFAKPQP